MLFVSFGQLMEASVSRDPPRGLRNLDYLLMFLVPVGGIALAQPNKSWRYFLRYGMAFALPFSINVLSKAIDGAYRYDHVWYPPVKFFIGLSCLAVVAGLIGNKLVEFIQKQKTECQHPAGG